MEPCQVVNWIDAAGSAITVVIAVFGCFMTFKKWGRAQEIQQTKYLKDLLDSFEKAQTRDIISVIESEDGSVKLEQSRELDKSFQFFSFLLYLKKTKQIDEQEFAFFKPQLDMVLANYDIRTWLESDVNKDKYSLLLSYADENGINKQEAQQLKSDAAKDDNATIKKSAAIGEDDFDCRTAIIRINRLYRENLNADELYEVTRGWWRVNPESAKKVRLALAVAFGIVKGVFVVERWEDSSAAPNLAGIDGRYRFVGHRADDITEAKYLGRSVSGLFAQGDAYPVRYFGPDR